MLFNSVDFLIFFPIVVLCYYLIPYKIRYVWLLIASYYFYMSWNPTFAILLGISTVVTYFCGLFIQKSHDQKKEEEGADTEKRLAWCKFLVGFSFVINLGMLVFFKYFDFVFTDLFAAVEALKLNIPKPSFDVLLPVGISFYTFKSLSYVMDVFREKTRAEKNVLKYSLYVSFFPQLAAGPIERSATFLDQVNEKRRFDVNQVRDGLLLMLWGFFQKLVISDRVAILVNQTFDYYQNYTGLQVVVAVFFFAIQIYCDFAGYSNIAIGASQVMGFNLMTNFDTPYFSKSVAEFWRRWHISLSSWFRDYLYIPLGGNRGGKQKKYRNIMIVFLTSGLWHGASWHYVVWGGLNGLYQVIGAELKPFNSWLSRKLKINTDAFSHKLLKTIGTFILVDLAWIFFRADDSKTAIMIILKMFQGFNIGMLFDGSLYVMNLDKVEFWIAVAGMTVMCFVSILKYKGMAIRETLAKQGIWFRYLIYFAALFAVLIFGIYGPSFDASEFIYFKF